MSPLSNQYENCRIFIPPNNLNIQTNDPTADKDKRGVLGVFTDERAGRQTQSHTSRGVIGLSKCNWGSLWPVMAVLTNTLTLSTSDDERG